MSCKMCENWSRVYGFCRVERSKPMPTGEPKTCRYYKKKRI